jgi:sulfur relay (sulfurtransferase) DsrC/TusE family protein
MKEMTENEVLIDIKRLFPTEEMYQEFLLFRTLNDKERDELITKKKKYIKTLSVEEMQKHSQNLDEGLQRVVDYYVEINLMEQLGDIPKNIPLSKVAENHFGKSNRWLYHQLKDTLTNRNCKVAGKKKPALAGASF